MKRERAPLAVYGTLGLFTLGVAFARDTSPVATTSWLELPAWLGHPISLIGGIFLAILTIRASRIVVARFGWARSLHTDLRGPVRGAGDETLLVLGLASGVAEELFFRGLLAPVLGVLLSSVAFGALHQLRGRTGWIWSGWATVMGLLFGALFLATGSLLGPVVAHVAINVTNLRYLRDTDVAPPKRRLGGLLAR